MKCFYQTTFIEKVCFEKLLVCHLVTEFLFTEAEGPLPCFKDAGLSVLFEKCGLMDTPVIVSIFSPTFLLDLLERSHIDRKA